MKAGFIRGLSTLAAVGLLCTACAFDGETATEARAEKGMEITGSRIPKRSARSPSEEGIKVLTRESLEQMQTGGHGAPAKGDATR